MNPANVYGRWYRIQIVSDGSERTYGNLSDPLTNEGIGPSIDGAWLKLPPGMIITRVEYEVHTIPHSTTTSMVLSRRAYSDGCQGVSLPSPSAFDTAFIYIHAYRA